jgi:hypothetical protein
MSVCTCDNADDRINAIASWIAERVCFAAENAGMSDELLEWGECLHKKHEESNAGAAGRAGLMMGHYNVPPQPVPVGYITQAMMNQNQVDPDNEVCAILGLAVQLAHGDPQPRSYDSNDCPDVYEPEAVQGLDAAVQKVREWMKNRAARLSGKTAPGTQG